MSEGWLQRIGRVIKRGNSRATPPAPQPLVDPELIREVLRKKYVEAVLPMTVAYPPNAEVDVFIRQASGYYFAQSRSTNSSILVRTGLADSKDAFQYDAPGFAESFPITTETYVIYEQVAILNANGLAHEFPIGINAKPRGDNYLYHFLAPQDWPDGAEVPDTERSVKEAIKVGTKYLQEIEERTRRHGLELLLVRRADVVESGSRKPLTMPDYPTYSKAHPFDPDSDAQYFATTNSRQTYLGKSVEEFRDLHVMVGVMPMGYTDLHLWERSFVLNADGVMASWENRCQKEPFDVILMLSDDWPNGARRDRVIDRKFPTVEEAVTHGVEWIRQVERIYNITGLRLLGVVKIEQIYWH